MGEALSDKMTRPRLTGPLALAVLVTLTLLFFWKILLTNLILVGVDTLLYFYPYKAYAAEALRQGRLPLWNPHLFMGAPLLANSQVGLFYPLNWLFLWLDPPKQVAWSIGLHIVLAGSLMLAYARLSLRLSWLGAMMAAVLFAFGGYLGAQVEHINQLNAAAWLPLLFLLYDFGVQRERRWLWFLLLAFVVAITLLAGHAQTVFISLFGLGMYGLWRATESANQRISEWRMANERMTNDETISAQLADHLQQITHRSPPPLSIIHNSQFTIHNLEPKAPCGQFTTRSLAHSLIHHLWPLVVVSALAVALAAIQLLPTAELSALSIRSGGLTFRETVSFSLRPTILHYALLPPFGLDLSQVLGEAFGEWVAYVGVSGLTLALLGGLCAIWRSEARRFVFLAGSGLVLSLGLFSGPLYLALYYLVPGFGLFRVPARWLLLYAFGVAVLAGFGLEALLAPPQLREHLASTWRWLRARWWRMAFLIGLPVAFLLSLIAWKTPPVITLVTWLVVAIVTFYILHFTLQSEASPWDAPRSTLHTSHFPVVILIPLLLAELFWAAQSLNYNQPTAPQAYHSLRNATAFLLAADPPAGPTPPSRFLSLSGITYDPGDLRELQQIYGDSLSAKALYNLIVATKEKEVLFFNLPLIYGLHSVDGYDGGLLPLTQFVTLQKLFLPPDDLSLDGRLREKLRFVPSGRLLSLLNTRWIITDKQFDVWIDDIFYDLQFPARLTAEQTISVANEAEEQGSRGTGEQRNRFRSEAQPEGGAGEIGVQSEALQGSRQAEQQTIPNFPATAIGLVSHLEGAADLSAGTPVAEVTLIFANGDNTTFTLKAGVDTAEGNYPAAAAHPQATIGVAWPYEAAGVDYITVHPLIQSPISNLRSPISSRQVTGISVTATLPTGQFVLRGLSLIHQPTTTSRSLLLTTEGDFRQVHSGDVKIYENRAVLPRAFVVHQAEVVQTTDQAIAILKDPAFNLAEKFVRLPHVLPFEDEHSGLIVSGQPSPRDQTRIVSYEPERVEIAVILDSPGWLVLTDAYYPGWQATVDGQPTEILLVNIMFRAVGVPAGAHTVVFEFKPRSVQVGAWVSGIAFIVLLVGLAGQSRPTALRRYLAIVPYNA